DRNVDVVVEPVLPHGGQQRRHFRHDSSNALRPWDRGARITGDQDTVAAAACLIQSDYRPGLHGNFEVVVPLQLPNGVVELRHFWRDNNNAHQPWNHAPRITHSYATAAAATRPNYASAPPGTHDDIDDVLRAQLPH